MTNSLLLVAWPWEGQVMMSFRMATAWMQPAPYMGKAKVTQISSFVNDSSYEVIYRCQNCFTWKTQAATVNISTTTGQLVLGRAQAALGPNAPGCPNKISFGFHDFGYGQYGANISNLTHASYSKWAALATKTVSTDCLHIPSTTMTTSTTSV